MPIKTKLLQVGNKMIPLVVLDACTILNLLRIDDEDSDFLLKLIRNWRVCLPETVFKETKLHVLSDFYTKEKNDHIMIAINQDFDHRKTLDSVIKKDLGDENFERVVKFCGHNKRENGELFCVALALVKSREEEEMVAIYTDDYKAIEEFRELYRYHRIGEFGDTLDLLTLLYWLTPEQVFQYSLYYSFLENLRAEYNHQMKDLADAIESYLERQKKNRCNDRSLLENLGKIVVGYRRSDVAQMDAGVRFFQEGNKYKDVKKLVENVDVKNVNRQMARITEHFRRLENYPIYRVA